MAKIKFWLVFKLGANYLKGIYVGILKTFVASPSIFSGEVTFQHAILSKAFQKFE